jgi:transcriptional regulator with PAS, ATPase and Fis domain
LLRFLEEREFYPVGGTEKRRVDVRIIAATNKSLEQEIKAGRFREDLFYRLNIAKISLPPLRDRKEDIIPIAVFFMNKFNVKHGKDFHEISTGAQKLLVNSPWTGNIRELRNTIERIVLMEEGSIIEPHHLSFLIHAQEIFTQGNVRRTVMPVCGAGDEVLHHLRNQDQYAKDESSAAEMFKEAIQHFVRQNAQNVMNPSTFKMLREALQHPGGLKTGAGLDIHANSINLDELNRSLLIQALQLSRGNKTKAAKLLGISRATAVYRIKKYGLINERFFMSQSILSRWESQDLVS